MENGINILGDRLSWDCRCAAHWKNKRNKKICRNLRCRGIIRCAATPCKSRMRRRAIFNQCPHARHVASVRMHNKMTNYDTISFLWSKLVFFLYYTVTLNNFALRRCIVLQYDVVFAMWRRNAVLCTGPQDLPKGKEKVFLQTLRQAAKSKDNLYINYFLNTGFSCF